MRDLHRRRRRATDSVMRSGRRRGPTAGCAVRCRTSPAGAARSPGASPLVIDRHRAPQRRGVIAPGPAGRASARLRLAKGGAASGSVRSRARRSASVRRCRRGRAGPAIGRVRRARHRRRRADRRLRGARRATRARRRRAVSDKRQADLAQPVEGGRGDRLGRRRRARAHRSAPARRGVRAARASTRPSRRDQSAELLPADLDRRKGGADSASGSSARLPDARLARVAVKVGGDDQPGAGERVGGIDHRALAARKHKTRGHPAAAGRSGQDRRALPSRPASAPRASRRPAAPAGAPRARIPTTRR